MLNLFLTVDPLGLAANGIASYLFYVKAICYAIAAVICIVGSLSVYCDMVDGAPEVRMKILRIVFSCVFLVSASTALPAFFGLDSSSSDQSFFSDSGTYEEAHNGKNGHDITNNNDPYVTPLPDGGTAIIWGH